MDELSAKSSPIERTFATPELLEHILTFLLCQLLPLTDQDPRSVRVHGNARILNHLLRCTEVTRTWQSCILGSKALQRALFLAPDHKTGRSWDPFASSVSTNADARAERRRLASYFLAPSLRAPMLNPVLQTTFAAYDFRFWHLSLESTGNKHCAYLIISRRSFPRNKIGADQSGTERNPNNISSMLLSQPPCTALEAIIWEERDETRDHVEKTTALSDAVIACEEGVTMGMVHESVAGWFREFPDVVAVKLTTAM